MLVDFLEPVVSVRLRKMSAAEMGLEPGEIRFPAGRCLCRHAAFVKDMDECHSTAVFNRLEVETGDVAVEGPGETVGRLDLGDPSGHAMGFQRLAYHWCPTERGGKLLSQLCGITDRPPNALDRMAELPFESQGGSPPDRF